MPGDLWEETLSLSTVILGAYDRPLYALHFRRPIVASDWTRFNLYAARVKEVTGCRYSSPFGYNVQVEPDAYQALINAAQSLPLIPLITTLNWGKTSTVASSKYIRFFIAPTLTNLSLCLSSEDGEYDFSLSSSLASLPQLCPSLSSLKLDTDMEDMPDERQKGEVSIRISSVLSAFRNLMHLQRLELSLPGLPEDALRNLISIDSLRYLLIFNEPSHRLQSPLPRDRRNRYFPCLEHLEIRVCSIEFCMSMLANMGQAPLQTFFVLFMEHPSAADWTTLFLMMHDQLGHRCLRNIGISSCSWIHFDVELTMEQLAPLLSFTNLTHMCLEHVEIALDDDDMVSIALAWPRLKTLHLPDQPFGSPHSVTFKGLASLARNCQVLNCLSLPSIGVTKVFLDDLDLYSTLRSSENLKLNTLSVRESESPIDNPTLVAALLSALFPNLLVIEADEFIEKWTQVMDSIQIFTAVRKQERLTLERNS